MFFNIKPLCPHLWKIFEKISSKWFKNIFTSMTLLMASYKIIRYEAIFLYIICPIPSLWGKIIILTLKVTYSLFLLTYIWNSKMAHFLNRSKLRWIKKPVRKSVALDHRTRTSLFSKCQVWNYSIVIFTFHQCFLIMVSNFYCFLKVLVLIAVSRLRPSYRWEQ